MEDQSTCGKGLAASAVLPEKLGRVIGCMAEVLEVHMKALDLEDPNARLERDAYEKLAGQQKEIADRLQANANAMASYQDLPVGRHDDEAMAGPESIEAFAALVNAKQELLRLLEQSAAENEAMLGEMRQAE